MLIHRVEKRLRPVLPLALGLVLGCGSDSLKPLPPVDPSAAYWKLELNHRAVLLSTAAPYDTLTLVATPRNVYGAALAGLPQPTYTSSDPNVVIVDTDGVLRVVAPTAAGSVVKITATLQDTAPNVTYTDYAMVGVVSADAAPAIASFSLHPVPPDSAKVAASAQGSPIPIDTLPLRVTDTAGSLITVMAGDSPSGGVLPIDIRIADTSIVQFGDPNDRTMVYGRRLGATKIYASTTVLGVTWTDTIDYRVGWPIFNAMVINLPGPGAAGLGASTTSNIFPFPDITLGTGGIVAWTHPHSGVASFDTTTQIDVRFADAAVSQVASLPSPLPGFLPFFFRFFCLFGADCTNSGNFVLGGQTGYRRAMRMFPVPGTYDYSSTAYPGSHGRIIVVDER